MRSQLLTVVLLGALCTVAQAAPKAISKAEADAIVVAAVQAAHPGARVTSAIGGYTLHTPKLVSSHNYSIAAVKDGKQLVGHVLIDMRAGSKKAGAARVRKIHLVADPQADAQMETLRATAVELRKRPDGGGPLLRQIESLLADRGAL
jgi:hypothetical protein